MSERLSKEQLRWRTPRTGNVVFVVGKGDAGVGYILKHFCEVCTNLIGTHFSAGGNRSWWTGDALIHSNRTGGSVHRKCIPVGASVRERAGN